MVSRAALAAGLALALVTAGCGGGSVAGPAAGGDSTPTLSWTPPSATPTPASTGPRADALPPGVAPGADDEVDERALVAAHDAALSNRSLTWRRTTRFQDEGGVVVAWGTLTLARDGSRKTLRTERGGAAPDAIPGRRPAVNYWTNGSTTVWRTERPNGSVGVRTAEGPPSGSFGDLDTGATAVASLLRGLELRYVGTTTSDGETLAVLATVDGAADVATVYVTETGVVRSVALRTTVEFDGVQLTRVVRFELSGVGETTVERPPWARNATAG